MPRATAVGYLVAAQSSRAFGIFFATSNEQTRETDGGDERPDAFEQHERQEVDQPGGETGKSRAQEVEPQVNDAFAAEDLQQIEQEGDEQQCDTDEADGLGREKTVHGEGSWE